MRENEQREQEAQYWDEIVHIEQERQAREEYRQLQQERLTAIALEDQAQPRQMLSNVFNQFNPSQVIPYLANQLIPNLHQHPLILQGQQPLQLQDRPAQQMLQIEDRHASIFEDDASPFQPTQYAPTRRRLSHKQAVDYIPVRPPNPPQQPGSSSDSHQSIVLVKI